MMICSIPSINSWRIPLSLIWSSSVWRHVPPPQRTGRPGIPPDRVLRCCVMKHLKGWSFRDLERELRSNLVYRRFTRFDAEVTPDFTTFRSEEHTSELQSHGT